LQDINREDQDQNSADQKSEMTCHWCRVIGNHNNASPQRCSLTVRFLASDSGSAVAIRLIEPTVPNWTFRCLETLTIRKTSHSVRTSHAIHAANRVKESSRGADSFNPTAKPGITEIAISAIWAEPKGKSQMHRLPPFSAYAHDPAEGISIQVPKRTWREIASLTTPALSIPFVPHLCMHSEKSAISLSLKVLLFQPKARS
jgi:hypothetical protein